MREMIWAASLPRPFRMTRRGALRALLALRTMPMAPSAAANLAGLVGVADDADGALGGGEGLVAGQEGEALGIVAQKHGAQAAVADADLAVLGDGAVDAEGLQADADGLGGVGGVGHAGLEGDGCAHAVGPACVLEADGLDALDDLIGIEAGFLADLAAFLDGADAVLGQDGPGRR